MPVFSSSSSLLDEVLVVVPLRDNPSMRPAEFPRYGTFKDKINSNLLTSSASVDGFLAAESYGDLGMF